MRINQYVAQSSDLSRRGADEAIAVGRVLINGTRVGTGTRVQPGDIVTLDGRTITPAINTTTVLVNKPAGYVCSRRGQGSKTIYDLLPPGYRSLNIAGRLDKDSSGLVILTSDGQLLQELSHPTFNKEKVYEVGLDRPLSITDFEIITKGGVDIGESRPSRFELEKNTNTEYTARLTEGRNRQIRRTFDALGYSVTKLHRTSIGNYSLGKVQEGAYEKAA